MHSNQTLCRHILTRIHVQKVWAGVSVLTSKRKRMKRASLISSYSQRLHLDGGSSLLSMVEIKESFTLTEEKETQINDSDNRETSYAH